MDERAAMLAITGDLTSDMSGDERFRRLIAALHAVIPCEAVTLLRLQDGHLDVVGVDGLVADAAGRRFRVGDHPRLAMIIDADGPVRFPTDSPLPDPYDGFLADDASATARIHACMGCPLIVGGRRVGVLTLDDRNPLAFASVSDDLVATWAGLAATVMRTAGLIDELSLALSRQELVSQQLMRDDHQRAGARLIGRSEAMMRLRADIELVARTDFAVLVTGETGTGKELVARAIHAASPRCKRPFIQVNCAALPETIAESELFGHRRGSFTGASADRPGKFEIADGGSLLLDEIGELPLSIQPKFLRVLQEGEIQRVGADGPIFVDVRVIAATNRDLEAEIAAGRFRSDLYHRIGVYPVHIAPLRDRRQDILVLAGHFLDSVACRLGYGQIRMTTEARAALVEYPWPGNVRELDHVLQRAALRACGGRRHESVEVAVEHLALGPTGSPGLCASVGSAASSALLRDAVDDFIRARIRDALAQCRGNWSAAARRLGVNRGNLHRLAKRLGLLGAQ